MELGTYILIQLLLSSVHRMIKYTSCILYIFDALAHITSINNNLPHNVSLKMPFSMLQIRTSAAGLFSHKTNADRAIGQIF